MIKNDQRGRKIVKNSWGTTYYNYCLIDLCEYGGTDFCLYRDTQKPKQTIRKTYNSDDQVVMFTSFETFLHHALKQMQIV